MSAVNQNELAELVTALRRYLPTSLGHRCLIGDRIADPVPCALHLAALLRTISTYLPRRVVASLLADPHPAQPRGEFSSGTVMFADISGFTAMSEKLSLLGKAGAEEVTGIINRLFTALLEISERYGGDLFKFGGDALIIHFGGEEHALRACQAAMQMQEAMGLFKDTPTSQGVFRLQMSIGIGSGPLFMVNLGSEEGMEFVVMGQAMSRMARAQSCASAGEVVIDSTALRQIAPYAVTQPRGNDFHQLLHLRKPVPELGVAMSNLPPLTSPPSSNDDLLTWMADAVRYIRALSPFLPPGMMDRLVFDPEPVLLGGEYRPVTVVFANFRGVDEIIEALGESRVAEITGILNSYFTSMRDLITVYGGMVNKVDPYTVGHRIMALFGAPRAHIDDPERAIRAALEMQRAIAPFSKLETSGGTFSIEQRIGVNTGMVFAGNVGAPTRREYSVMGDGVNLAARLMGVAAEGQILISHSTAEESGGVVLFREQQPVRVKGKSMPVRNYLVLGLQERRVREPHPLIGRDEEWHIIREAAEAALSGQPQVLAIVGEAGLGKSRLLEELISCWHKERGGLAVPATCHSFSSHTPYSLWLEVLRVLFGISPSDPTWLKLEKITAMLQEIKPVWRDWSVLMGRLLGLEVEETAMIQALDASTRQRLIFGIVEGLLRHRAGGQPLLLAVDDLHWADEASLALLNHIARRITDSRGKSLAFMLAVAHRTERALSLDISGLPHYTEVRLKELSDAHSLHLLDTLLPSTPQLPQQLKELIIRNAQGNPLFIEAIAQALIENYLVLDKETGTYQLRAALEEVEVPDSVHRVIMSRIDRLDESSRNILRVASVIGQRFWYWLLSSIYPYRYIDLELRQHLDELVWRDLLSGPIPPDPVYLFHHILTREVAYESLLYADRRMLHRRIGESIKQQRAGQLTEYWEILAYHFSLAEEWGEAMDYHLKVGHRAREMYANDDAIHHYRRALEAAGRVKGSERQQLEAHEGLAEVLDTVGKYEEALNHLHSARQLVELAALPAEDAGRRQAELCCRIAGIYEKKSDYDTAFNWLQEGLRHLGDRESIEMAKIYRLGAGVYQRQGNYGAAIDWCTRSLLIARKLGGREGQAAAARAEYLLGLIYYRLGDMAQTIQLCQESLAMYEQLEDIPGAAQASMNLANAYYDRGAPGDWSRAIEYYLRALEITRKVGDVHHQAMITLNLGSAYLDQGDLARAAEYYHQSLEMCRELGFTYAIALLHNNMGIIAIRSNEPARALEMLKESEALFQRIGSTDFLSEVYRHQSEAYLGMMQLDEAMEYARRSLELAREREMRLEEGATRRVLGQVYAALGTPERALEELESSVAILKELGSRYEMARTLFQLAHLYRQQEQFQQMHEHLEQAIAIFDDLGAQLDLAEARALRTVS